MSKLGRLDHIEAIEFARQLWLWGSGTNPTSGWRNWLEPIKDIPNTYEFLQDKPTGIVLEVVTPFTVLSAFPYSGAKEVIVREAIDGKPTDKRVPVRKILPIEEQTLGTLLPATTLNYLDAKSADRAILPGATLTIKLGSFDIPGGCFVWTNPLRARRYEFFLEVDALLPSPDDIKRVVLDCLKQGAIAAVLVALLSPIGWAGAIPTFEKVMEACLLSKLGNKLVRVKVTCQQHCL